MKRITARLIIALGLGLVALGRKLHPEFIEGIDPKPTQPARVVTLPRRHYRTVPPTPRRPLFTLFVVLATG